MPTTTLNVTVSAVGASLLNTASPGAVTWIRVNADNSVTYRSASETRTDLGVGLVANGGTGLTAVGGALQLLRTNAGATGLEYVTPTTSIVAEGSNLYYTDARVRATTLTGLSVSGGSVSSTDTMLSAVGQLQNQINSLVGGVNYRGTWNATTNSPALASGVGTKGYYYVVSVAGSTNLDGITDWKLGDWAIFNGTTWEKVDNTDAVISVNGYIGAVTLVKADVGLGNVENTALSTWAGSSNITTLGTIGTGTWQGSGIAEAYLSVSDNTTKDVSNAAHGFFPKLTANSIYYVNNSGALTALTVGAAGTVLTGNGVTSAPTWAAAASGITINSTAISGGGANRVLFENSSNQVSESATDFYFNTGSPENHMYAYGRTGVLTGVRNVAVGIQSLRLCTTATKNVAIGAYAGYNTAVNISDCVFIGNLAGSDYAGSGALTAIGSSAGSSASGSGVLIGQLTVGGSASAVVAIGNSATATSNNSTAIGSSSTASTGIGATAVGATSSATNGASLAVGYAASSAHLYSMAFGVTTTTTADNQVIFGSNYNSLGGVGGIAEFCVGNGDSAASAVGFTLRTTNGSGTNNQGANITYNAGRSTGNKTGGYHSWGTSDAGASGTTLRAITEKARLVGGGDLVLGITSDTKGLVLKDSAGHYWRISVSTLGVLSTADLGTSIPT